MKIRNDISRSELFQAPVPNVLNAGWKKEVHYLLDLCFADMSNTQAWKDRTGI